MNTWTTTQGSGTANTVTIKDGRGLPIAFQGDESFTVEVWAGDDQSVLFTPSWSWNAAGPASGRIDIPITADQTAPLMPGRYNVLVKYADGTGDCYYGYLEILPAPGTAVARKAYCSLDDMLRYAAWVKLVQSDSDQAGFLEQRAEARDWIVDLGVRSYRGSTVGQFGEHSRSGMLWGGGGPRRSIIPSKLIRDYFEADKLMVRPEVVRLAAHKAISIVGLSQIGVNNQFAAYGAYHQDKADALAASITLELDTNDDGIPEIGIPIGATNTLFT